MRWVQLDGLKHASPIFIDLEKVMSMEQIVAGPEKYTLLTFMNERALRVMQTPEQILAGIGWREIDAETR